MIDDKRLRELCARALQAHGRAFREAIAELSDAIDSWQETREGNGTVNHQEDK